jgi:class 3 adenylate cyclase
VDEVLASTDIDDTFAARAMRATGLSEQTELFDDDLEALHWMDRARRAGFPDDALIQLLRVYTDALNRVAQAENWLFHYYVHEQFRRDGLTGRDLMNATSMVSQSLVGLVEPSLLYFHRKAWERALRDDLILHLIEDASGEPPPIPGTVHATTLFVDLSSFTTLTSALGDDAAARTLDRFSDLVRATAVRRNGKLVKQIGDAFMLVFTDPSEAVTFGLDVRDAATHEPDFPSVRIGAHHGDVLYREGDYVGSNVNIAARVAALAQRDQFLVTDAVRASAAQQSVARYAPLGPQQLKGIPEDTEVFRVARP